MNEVCWDSDGLGDRGSILFHSVRIDSAAHSMGTTVLFSLVEKRKNDRGVTLTTPLHLGPKSRIVELYLHFPYIFMV
jgi:hypothetical protein